LPSAGVFYYGTSIIKNVRQYSFTTTSNGGRATFFPTTTGTTTGTALFTTIYHASATATLNTTQAAAVPFCGLNSISADREIVIFNVVTGVVSLLGLGASTMQAAANGTVVTAFIVGLGS
jgi:hypothetical protein